MEDNLLNRGLATSVVSITKSKLKYRKQESIKNALCHSQ
jgi:hypothetical protein